MRARHLLLAVCVTSCLAVACGDDDESAPGKTPGVGGEAGAASPGSAGKGGSSGSPTNGGSGNSAGTSPVGEAGQPGGGMPTEPGAGGTGGEASTGFVDFVHDLVKNQTTDTDQPARTDQKFADPQDDHGHYLVAPTAFDDLF